LTLECLSTVVILHLHLYGQKCCRYFSWILAGLLIIYNLGVFFGADLMTAIMALLKAFNLLVIGVFQPYAVQASIDRRRQFVADQVAAMDRKEIFAMDVCSVCLSGMTVKNSRATPCGHVFHETCLITWLTENVTCPMCRCVIRRANDDKATWAGMVGNEILLAQQQQEQELRVNLIRAAIEQQQVNQQLLQLQLQPASNWQHATVQWQLPQQPAQAQQRNAPHTALVNCQRANAPASRAQAHGVVVSKVPYVLH
jgi:hypothetical protein